MRTLSILFFLILSSFVISKDDLLQKMYDNIEKDKVQMPTNYYSYIKNIKVKIQTISKIIDKSLLTTLDKVGVPKNLANHFKMANFAKIVSGEEYEASIYNKTTTAVFQYGAAMVKGDKGRFAYFEVSLEAENIQQKETIVIPHKKKKKTWNEFKVVNRSFKSEEVNIIKKYLRARAQIDLLNRIKTLKELTTDGDNFFVDTTNLKFLA